MKITGIIMMLVGGILLLCMFLPLFTPLIPRGGLPWTFTWAAVLGILIFPSGFALFVVAADKRYK